MYLLKTIGYLYTEQQVYVLPATGFPTHPPVW